MVTIKRKFAAIFAMVVMFLSVFTAVGITATAQTGSQTFSITPSCAEINGVTFTAPTTATYRFTYVSGAWNPWPADANLDWWYSNVWFYVNRPIDWQPIGNGGEGVPANPDNAFTSALYPTAAQAEAANIGHTIDIPLTAGQYVIMTAPDGQSGYCGNGYQGASIISVALAAQPITVVSTDPANNAVNVPLAKAVNVVFNQNVQPGADFGKIKVIDSATGKRVSISTQMVGGRLQLTPTTIWDVGKTYVVTIPKAAVKDANGNTLASDYTFRFTASTGLQLWVQWRAQTNAQNLNGLMNWIIYQLYLNRAGIRQMNHEIINHLLLEILHEILQSIG